MQPSIVIMPTILHNYYYPHFIKEETEALNNLPKHTVSGLLSLKSRPSYAPNTTPLAHLLFAHVAFVIRIFRPGWNLSQLTRLSHIFHPSQAKSRGKPRRETWGATGISSVLPDPRDLNVKQMGPRHSSKTHAVLFSSFDTSFGYICLFFLKYICAHKLETKVHRQKPFLEMFCLLLRKDGKEKNSAILLTAEEKLLES